MISGKVLLPHPKDMLPHPKKNMLPHPKVVLPHPEIKRKPSSHVLFQQALWHDVEFQIIGII
jgi:hypothetical protein